MQMLEGRKEVVLRLMEWIQADPRHSDLREVISGESRKRIFPDWSMGFRDMNLLDQQANFACWQKRIIRFTDLAEDAQICYALITAFS